MQTHSFNLPFRNYDFATINVCTNVYIFVCPNDVTYDIAKQRERSVFVYE